MMKKLIFAALLLSVPVFFSCHRKSDKKDNKQDSTANLTPMQKNLAKFAKVTLTTDLSFLSEKEKQILSILFDVAQIMDDIFWKQNYGDKMALLNSVTDEDTKKFILINYGPWDNLDNHKPFVEGVGEKPAGAQFYPANMTKEEFEKWNDPNKLSQYTLIQRDDNGKLMVVWYHKAYEAEVKKASELMLQAAALAEDPGLKKYLELRAKALLTDDYFASDMAWMDMKNSNIDFVVGPIENYTDGLFGAKSAYESFILVKDRDWSQKLARFNALLPDLQKNLPVDVKFKKDKIGTDSDINVYDAIFYAGDCNDGSKTIAINLPNDVRVQMQKGTRKLQLKNAMKAKFDNILVPISNLVIDENQRKHIKFNAFFENVMFHEVAHGMGIKNTINGKGKVQEALKNMYNSMEEGKADILGLWLVTELHRRGELKEGEVMDNYVTFVAGLFRSIRFGAASAHGKANMVRFNYFMETGAITRNDNGTYTVNFEKMQKAVVESVKDIIRIQGEGDFAAAEAQINQKGKITEQLQKDLDRINNAGIPVDIVFEQGKQVLGLK